MLQKKSLQLFYLTYNIVRIVSIAKWNYKEEEHKDDNSFIQNVFQVGPN